MFVSATETSVNFDITDTGIGIRREDIPLLFEAFSQTDVQKNRNKKGTGLGLAITKSLIDMMGGLITVESEYGQGTVFHLSVPKVLGDETQILRPGGGENILYAPDAKVLVVDDNSINLNVACGLLHLFKITAETAASGQQAIELIRCNQYDLVFMDHMMPEMDGAEATRIIRKMGINIPVIAFTANAIAGVKEEFLAAGMNDLLTKPINKALLIKILEDWLPAEKIERTQPDKTGETGIVRQDEFWRRIGQIEGISVQTGLERVSGQWNVLEKSLHLTMKEIKKCDRNLNNFLAAGDMRNFSIEVHSMKGSLTGIGAMELSLRAYELENAADSADTSFCALNMPPFLEALRGLGQNLADAFTKIAKNHDLIKISRELARVFERLKLAFSENDFSAINDGMESLDAISLSSALKEEIEKIKDAVLMMDYEGAIEVMSELLKFPE